MQKLIWNKLSSPFDDTTRNHEREQRLLNHAKIFLVGFPLPAEMRDHLTVLDPIGILR